MKKKQKKERKRIIKVIVSVLLLMCICSTGAYTIISYENTKNELINYHKIVANETFNNISLKLSKDTKGNYYTLGSETTVDDPTNTYIGIYLDTNTNSVNKELLAETEICQYSGFSGNSSSGYPEEFDFASLNYTKLKNSMSKSQYNKILNYLNTPADTDGTYYELVCTEFYVTKLNAEVLPKTVEIVKTTADNTWYAEDTPVESFKLNIKDSVKDLKLVTIGEMNRNCISTDYIINNYSNKEIKSIVNKMDKSDVELCETAPFTYVIINRTDKAIFNSNENVSEDEEKIEGKIYHRTYEPVNYSITYGQRFNVLDECLSNIITVDLFILLFFVIIGAVLTLSIIHTFNTRTKQEEKRIEMTNAFAHNLKTPLLVISGFAENLIENVNTEKKDYYSKIIKEQTIEMNNIIQRMLEFSRVDSSELKLKKADFNLNDLIDELLKKYAYTNNEIIINSDKNIIINGDREILKLALDNLIENAVKYSSDNGNIIIRLSDNYFEISNPCKGLDKTTLKKLWQPYFRLNDTSSKGNGIGLSIVQSVFNLHKFKYGSDINEDIIKFYFSF